MFETDFGEAKVNFALFDDGCRGYTEGIEIHCDLGLIEVYGYYDIDELTKKKVSKLIDSNR